MVYSCGVDNVYEYAVDRELIGSPYEDLFEIQFENPDEVDAIAQLPKHAQMNEGYRVIADSVPAKMQWGDKRKAVPDFIVLASTPIVSQRAKDIIEEFEPGAHQFVPIDLYHRKSSEPFARYYWFVICKLIDTIDEEKTTYPLKMSPWAEGCGGYDGMDGSGRLVHSAKKIGSHHCWREKFAQRWWHISDELSERFKSEDIIGLGKHKQEAE